MPVNHLPDEAFASWGIARQWGIQFAWPVCWQTVGSGIAWHHTFLQPSAFEGSVGLGHFNVAGQNPSISAPEGLLRLCESLCKHDIMRVVIV